MRGAELTVVAEISGEHRGEADRAMALIEAAAKAGADAVKFQAYTAETMVLDHDYFIEDGPWKGRNLYLLYHEAQTPYDWFPSLFAHASSLGLFAFSSVFDRGGLAMLERLGCPAYKISSFELVDLDLIRAVAKTGKPMVLSTGMASAAEIARAVVLAQAAGELTLLHCVSAYPLEPGDLALGNLADMRERFHCKVGLSDHSPPGSYLAAAYTVGLGASVIERHITLGRTEGGPDAGFALEPAEFARLVTTCRAEAKRPREVDVCAHAVRYGPRPSEASSLGLRRSLWLAAPVLAGERLRAEHLQCARPALGMQPWRLRSILRRTAARDLVAGEPLTEDMLL